jgi:glyoxylase-like metal-dependent hydrolase (beta-lactamase superfamily II)
LSAIVDIPGFDVVLVRADNPGPMTLSGTNTWVLGRDPAWVVDPGPADAAHLDAVAAVATARGGAGGIALTHGHVDHEEGVEPLRERLGEIDVLRYGEPGALRDGGSLTAIHVPGHADDHLVFLWDRVAFTGDAVLGEGSVFVAGDMAGYLDGLRRLRELELDLLCPGHGPPVHDPAGHIDGYLAHRLDRERRLGEALASGIRGEEDLLAAVWSDAPAALRGAAALTLRSHLRKLGAEGRLPADVVAPAVGGVPAV